MGFLCGFSGEGYSQVSKLLCKWQIVLVFSFKYLLKTDNWVLIYSLALAIPTIGISHLLSIYRPLSSWRGKFSENLNSECDIYIFLLSLKLDNWVLCFLTKAGKYQCYRVYWGVHLETKNLYVDLASFPVTAEDVVSWKSEKHVPSQYMTFPIRWCSRTVIGSFILQQKNSLLQHEGKVSSAR